MSKNRNLIKELTTKLSNFKLSQEEKLDILKDCFKGEKAYLFSCGPSLLDHDEDKIKDILKNNLCFGVKQVFELYKEDLDVHFYNCANFKFYDYSKNEPIVIKCLSGGLKAGFAHISFGIEAELKKTADDFSVSISETGDLDRALFENNPLIRPIGPGIEYEIIFPALLHFGISEFVTIGWDNKAPEGMPLAKSNFYYSEKSGLDASSMIQINNVSAVPAAVASLQKEASTTTNAIEKWYNFMLDKGCVMKICSPINPAPSFIERVVL